MKNSEKLNISCYLYIYIYKSMYIIIVNYLYKQIHTEKNFRKFDTALYYVIFLLMTILRKDPFCHGGTIFFIDIGL